MEALGVASQTLYSSVSSPYFMLAHAFSCSYYTRTNAPQDTFFKSVIATVIYAAGGGILSSLLLGEPIALFYNPGFLPCYTLMTLAMYRLHFYITPYLEYWKPLFKSITAASSGASMINVVTKFKDSAIMGREGRNATFSLFLFGVIAASGGGFLHTCIFKRNVTVDSYFLKVVGLTSVLVNVLMFVGEGEVKGEFVTPLTLFGVLEWKFVASALLLLGLVLEPVPFKRPGKNGSKDKEEAPITPKAKASTEEKEGEPHLRRSTRKKKE